MSESVLQVRDLKVHYRTPRGPVKAVDGVSFDLLAGERFGLVGESGSGKSTTVLAILRLLKPPAHIEAGAVLLNGADLAAMSEDEIRKMRLAEIALVPQGAMNSLNPVMRVREQMLDGVWSHHDGKAERRSIDWLVELLETVGLEPQVLQLYPHELSGGMKQRVCIAMAITLRPKVVIADEPTSALDVVVQRRIMETLANVQKRLGASILLVGHDMGLMAQFVDRIGVMYGGRLVEVAPVRDIFEEPLHPYSQLLISSLPTLERKGVFRGIPGSPPSLLNPPSGCVFHPRCPKAFDRCPIDVPELQEVRTGHWVACHLYNGRADAARPC